jgi:hypothetical protein
MSASTPADILATYLRARGASVRDSEQPQSADPDPEPDPN